MTVAVNGAKERLERHRMNLLRIERYEDQIKELRAKINSVTQRLTDMQVMGGEQKDRSDRILKLVELEEELEGRVVSLYIEETNLVLALAELEREEYATVLTLRYLEGKTWDEVADEMECSKRACYGYQGQALKELNEILDRED